MSRIIAVHEIPSQDDCGGVTLLQEPDGRNIEHDARSYPGYKLAGDRDLVDWLSWAHDYRHVPESIAIVFDDTM